MPSRLELAEENIGKCLADHSRLDRRITAESEMRKRQIEELKEEMRMLAKAREHMGSETHVSWRPLGISVTLKNVAPWALVLLLSLAALIVALVKR